MTASPAHRAADETRLSRTRQPTVTGPLVAVVEATWTEIQNRHGDVPDVVLTVGGGSTRPGQLTLGRFHAAKWATASDSRLPELFLGGEGLARGGRAVLGTLLHEAAHGVAATRYIQDTSREGRYHNARFRQLGAELGLTLARHPVIGWSVTSVPEDTARSYSGHIDDLDGVITAYRLADLHQSRAGGSARNGVVAVCACVPARRIRLAETTFAAGPIECGVCGAPFDAAPGEPR